MARKRKHSSSKRRPRAHRRRSRGRRSSGGFAGFKGGKMLGGFVNTSVLMSAGAATAGFIGIPMLLDHVPLDQVKTGTGRIVGKAVAGLVAAYALRKAGQSAIGNGVAIGALVAAGVDTYNRVKAQQAMAGLGAFENGVAEDVYPGYGNADLEGMGDAGDDGDDGDGSDSM